MVKVTNSGRHASIRERLQRSSPLAVRAIAWNSVILLHEPRNADLPQEILAISRKQRLTLKLSQYPAAHTRLVPSMAACVLFVAAV